MTRQGGPKPTKSTKVTPGTQHEAIPRAGPLVGNPSAPARNHPFPIHVPQSLLDGFRLLGTEPILSGGSAVQVWTGRSDEIFQTHDLDFITHLTVSDLVKAGIVLEKSGRHAVVDGIAIEFPSGPLGVGNLYLDPHRDSVLTPTTSGGFLRCIRPEACVLDRLSLVAGSRFSAGFLQAAAVVVAQSKAPGWDDEWIDGAAMEARLGKLWEHLKAELEREHPSASSVDLALEIGWDP